MLLNINHYLSLSTAQFAVIIYQRIFSRHSSHHIKSALTARHL